MAFFLGRRRCCFAALTATALLSGCLRAPAQSMVHPAGPAAAEIAWLWWLMLASFTAVFLGVMLLLWVAISSPPRSSLDPEEGGSVPADGNGESPSRFGRLGFILGGGLLLPIAVLTPLFILSLRTSASLQMPEEALTIRVVGHMWWWEVRYPDQGIVTANEIHIPAGKPVRLELTSVDVIHSFWVPRLHGKRDMIPGVETEFWIQASEAGVYRGQCAEYCGTQHANMAFNVVALPPEEFEQWIAERTAARPEPATDAEQRGFRIFMTAGCPQCHALRGTQATGNAGPDLTHLATRRTLGAGMRPNTKANLAGWIANPQGIKPGAKMPRTYLAADDLLTLTDFLESQR